MEVEKSPERKTTFLSFTEGFLLPCDVFVGVYAFVPDLFSCKSGGGPGLGNPKLPLVVEIEWISPLLHKLWSSPNGIISVFHDQAPLLPTPHQPHSFMLTSVT